jgi:aryl-alcohol dehydrogenase-like predicted oxidoreductase
MKYVHIPKTDLQLSALCYGLATFGSVVRGEKADRLYSLFREAGGNFFDTAHCYSFWLKNGLGASERALGECVRRHRDRRNIFIATKGGHPDGGSAYPRPDRYLAAEVLASDIEESLGRLRVDRIDLYYLHRDDPRVPVAEILGALNAEIGRGRIRYLGASNWSVRRMAEANAYAERHDLHGFVASQPQWSLAFPNEKPPRKDPATRFLRDADMRWQASQGLPVIPYSPTACGYFATSGRSAKAAFDNPTSRERLKRVRSLARKLGCTPNQIALAYLLGQKFPVIPILGTTKVSHLKDALAAVDVELTPQQVAWLRKG